MSASNHNLCNGFGSPINSTCTLRNGTGCWPDVNASCELQLQEVATSGCSPPLPAGIDLKANLDSGQVVHQVISSSHTLTITMALSGENLAIVNASSTWTGKELVTAISPALHKLSGQSVRTVLLDGITLADDQTLQEQGVSDTTLIQVIPQANAHLRTLWNQLLSGDARILSSSKLWDDIETLDSESLPLLPAVQDLLRSSDASVRVCAAEAIQTMGALASSAVPALQELLEDNVGAVVYRALEALAEMGEASDVALPRIRKLYETSDDDRVVMCARIALKKLEGRPGMKGLTFRGHYGLDYYRCKFTGVIYRYSCKC